MSSSSRRRNLCEDKHSGVLFKVSRKAGLLFLPVAGNASRRTVVLAGFFRDRRNCPAGDKLLRIDAFCCNNRCTMVGWCLTPIREFLP